ncbi:MAG TPA: DUF484 family protein [Burkholderiales bacterium]|jgi:hypothetical protein|nr:DUF484 family protein [Burkholderiales bacterium]
MDPNDVAQFLKSHPQFFDQFPQLLETIYVPHPHGGRAIPLTERQIVTLREKVKLLEGKLGELIRFGEDNDAIGEKVHRLSLALLGAKDFAGTVHALYFHLREDFSVPHVALRVWGRSLLDGTLEGSPVEPELRDKAETMGAPQCGPASGSPYLPWFREAQEHVRSLALVPLGQTRTVGLLALGSEDPQRFFAEMGTLYLRRIGELTAGALAATV